MKSKYIIGEIILFCSLNTQVVLAQNTLVGRQVKVENLTMTHNGNNFILNMDMNLDSLKVKSNSFLVFTPYIESYKGNDSSKFVPIMVDGRKQHIMYERGNRKKRYPSVVEVKRNGKSQSIHYLASVPYETWMGSYKLNIAEDLCGCGNILEQNSSTILKYYGILPLAPILTIKPDVGGKKERSIEGRAFLDFPVNKITIYPDYRKNPTELSKIIETINVVNKDRNVSIESISIHGYASPEGSYKNNVRLAEGRALALKNYVKRLFHFSDNQLSDVKSTPEDWDGLKNYLINSSYSEKQDIIKIINSNELPDMKESEIKKEFPQLYSVLLKNIYPGLRHSDYIIKYTIRPFSLEESKSIYKTNPGNLSVEEMYKLAKDVGFETKEGRDILEMAARLNPNNVVANLNAAQAALRHNDIESADAFADKSGNSPESLYTKGAIKMAKGDLNTAAILFEQAKNGGIVEADKALDIINQYKY